MSFWDWLSPLEGELWSWWPTLLALAEMAILVIFLPWVLMTKEEATSAVAWCLAILFLPLLGALLFCLFGYQHVRQPLARKRQHRERYQAQRQSARQENENSLSALLVATQQESAAMAWQEALARLALRFDGWPLTTGNQVALYADGASAYQAMQQAIAQARHHVHLETFILQPDAAGQEFLSLLTQKARAGVEVRLLYDAMGSLRLRPRHVQALRDAGGKVSAFLPVNPLRRRFQVNLRNHRKILVVDGCVGFVGGLNIGEEYLGRVPRFGFWRDAHVRLEGPAVHQLQGVFAEDWNFATGEYLDNADNRPARMPYFPDCPPAGDVPVQIVHSGPDQDLKTIREIYLAAILRARQRVWIASPYFVPDAGLRDALRLAAYLGIDVRFLGLFQPDKWIPYYAARYYWEEMLAAGVQIYQYTRGMMHAKVLIVDDCWASVGTANMDNRSLHLNFEVNSLFYSPRIAAALEAAFRRDLADSIRLRPTVYRQRPVASKLLENTCRLLSPIL
jgi:cardiolipin synthase